MTHEASQLLSLLARISFRLGQFTLSSGTTSDYYIDCRTTTLHAEGGRLTGHSVLSSWRRTIYKPKPSVDSPSAQIPSSPTSPPPAPGEPSTPARRCIHGFLVRKAEKAHGAGRRIEGFCREGARVIIVDDVCTTGASTIDAIEAARAAGMIVAAVVCIVEREEANGRPAVEAAAQGSPFLYASSPRTRSVQNTSARSDDQWLVSAKPLTRPVLRKGTPSAAQRECLSLRFISQMLSS